MNPLLSQVRIRNYRSLARVDVLLDPWTALVGPAGSGKSSFLDALAFVQECLSGSVELALTARGGIGAVRRASHGHPTHIGIRLTMRLNEDTAADYAFEIAAKEGLKFTIARERCLVHSFMQPESEKSFETREGLFSHPVPGAGKQVPDDRLALASVLHVEEFRGVFEFLTSFGLYDPDPAKLGGLQKPDSGLRLRRDAGNGAAVLKSLEGRRHKNKLDKLCSYLARICPGVEHVGYKAQGRHECIQFTQAGEAENRFRFEASSMSRGTLRALGVLLALLQDKEVSVLAVDEPDALLHPGAGQTLLEALLEGAGQRQVLVTSCSPWIMECRGLDESRIRVASALRGSTIIDPLTPASRKAALETLITPGATHPREAGKETPAAMSESEQKDLFGLPSFEKV